MTPVFQTIIDRGNGNCMQAAVASLLDLPLDGVPHFISLRDQWWSTYHEFMLSHGYDLSRYLYNNAYESMSNTQSDCFVKPSKNKWALTPKKLYREDSINGYFHASVLSPGNWTLKDADRSCHHSVIIDRDYKIVHDPNPNYKSIISYPLAHLIGYNGVIMVDIVKKIK